MRASNSIAVYLVGYKALIFPTKRCQLYVISGIHHLVFFTHCRDFHLLLDYGGVGSEILIHNLMVERLNIVTEMVP